LPCPTGTTTAAAGASLASSCAICAGGYSGAPTAAGSSGAGCSICTSGAYAAPGSASCTACPAGVSTPNPGSVSVAACTVCATGYHGTLSNPGTTSAAGCHVIDLITDQSLCSANTILGSSTDYAVLPASSAFNTQAVDVVVARADVCTKLSRSSGTLRCSPSTLQYTDPQTALVMSYVGRANIDIPIGGATVYGAAC